MRGSVVKQCLTCGNAFRAWNHEKAKYCSKKCFNEQHQVHITTELLEQLYTKKQQSITDIGKLVGCSASTIGDYLRRFNIPVRGRGESFRLKRERGEMIFNPRRGKNHPLWKGYRVRTGQYVKVYLPEHPRARKDGYVLEHIVIWEKAHGKLLNEGYIIHHLNGIKDDNRPENLSALPTHKHLYILEAKAKRIRELEARVKVLSRAVEQQQGVFIELI